MYFHVAALIDNTQASPDERAACWLAFPAWARLGRNSIGDTKGEECSTGIYERLYTTGQDKNQKKSLVILEEILTLAQSKGRKTEEAEG